MTHTRKNLAYDLLDPDQRREHLHPRTYTLRQILKRMYQPVLRTPRIVAASIAFALTHGMLPVLTSFIIYYLAWLVEQAQVQVSDVIISAAVYTALTVICSLVSIQVLNRNYAWFMDLRLSLMNRCLLQYMTMDYGIYENSAMLDDIGNWQRSLSGNNQGLEGTYHKIFEMGGTIVSALLLALILVALNPAILLVGIAFLAVYYLSQSNVAQYKHARRTELQRVSRRTLHLASEAADFRYGKDTRLYSMQDRFSQAFRPLLQAYTTLYRAFTRREYHCSFAESAALVAIDAVSLIVLVRRYQAGAIDLATIVMLLTVVTLFSQTLQLLGQQLAYVKHETLYVGDTFNFLDAALTVRGGSTTISRPGPLEVCFESVSFHYPGSDELVLENLNLTLEAGSSYALVGVNGAGKTTLVKLLTGLYQPTSGRIWVNGSDATSIPQQELFELFGVVFQEVQPLALTVAENVAGADEAIDRERVVRCLQTVGLWDKIQSYPQGIDSPMLKVIHDDGIILSGGENQKLAMARCLYRVDTRMLILDEPTSALDALAEERIYREFEQILSGRTALFISHRLASTRFCDHIVLLDGGRITQQGTHDSLMQEEGLYRHMYETQGKYYQEVRDDETA